MTTENIAIWLVLALGLVLVGPGLVWLEMGPVVLVVLGLWMVLVIGLVCVWLGRKTTNDR
jgi:hypothetical protein